MTTEQHALSADQLNLPASSLPSPSPSLSLSSISDSTSSSSVAKSKTMLKLWPSNPAIDAQLTPRAGPNGQERRNPFDIPPASPTGSARTSQGAASPLFSPSTFQHHHLLSPGASLGPGTNGLTVVSPGPSTPTAGIASTAALPHLSLHAPEFNMRAPPPSKRPPATPKTETATATASTNGATNAVTTAPATAPTNGATPDLLNDDNVSVASSASNSAASTVAPASSTAPPPPTPVARGQIHVKLIQARGLSIKSPHARPYVVVQFEQNDFVSRDPIAESDKEAKGTATARGHQPQGSISNVAATTTTHKHQPNGSVSSAVSALDALTIKDDARKQKLTSANTSPASSVSSGKSTMSSGQSGAATPAVTADTSSAGSGPASYFGRLSAHNPVWKHEVSL